MVMEARLMYADRIKVKSAKLRLRHCLKGLSNIQLISIQRLLQA
jgi:hypothetical protein